MLAVPMMMKMAMSSDVAVITDANSIPMSITGTNLQETTMDKPDLVKTMNDETMLVLQQEKLHTLGALDNIGIGSSSTNMSAYIEICT